MSKVCVISANKKTASHWTALVCLSDCFYFGCLLRNQPQRSLASEDAYTTGKTDI